VGQKVMKFGVFSDHTRKISALTPNAAEYCNSEKNFLSTDGCSTRNATFRELGVQTPEIHAPYYCS